MVVKVEGERQRRARSQLEVRCGCVEVTLSSMGETGRGLLLWERKLREQKERVECESEQAGGGRTAMRCVACGAYVRSVGRRPVETSQSRAREDVEPDPGKENLLGRRPLPFLVRNHLDTGHYLLMSEQKAEQSPHIPAHDLPLISSITSSYCMCVCVCLSVSLPYRDFIPRCSHLIPSLADSAGEASLDFCPAYSTG